MQDTGEREIIKKRISERQDGLGLQAHSEESACPILCTYDFGRQVAEPTSIYCEEGGRIVSLLRVGGEDGGVRKMEIRSASAENKDS